MEPPLRVDDVRGWKNIAPVVTDAVARLCTSLEHVQQDITQTRNDVAACATAAQLQEATARCVGMEQFTDLARFVQRDVLAKMDLPCPAHHTVGRTIAQLSARLSTLEGVVSSQDKLIQHLQSELAARVTRADIDSMDLATRSGVESHVRGLASLSQLESSLASKADAASIHAIVTDLHTLNSELERRAVREELVAYVDSKVAGGISTARSQSQHSVDTAMRTLAELKRSIEAKAGKDEVPGAWKAKVASITAAFDSKLAATKSEMAREVHEELERQLTEVVTALNKKAYKSDVTRALGEKLSAADLSSALAGKADASSVDDALRRKADAAEVSSMRRAIIDLTQSLLASKDASSSEAAAMRALQHLRSSDGLDASTASVGPSRGIGAALQSRSLAPAGLEASSDSLRSEVAALRDMLTHDRVRLDALAQEVRSGGTKGRAASPALTTRGGGDTSRMWDECSRLAERVAGKADAREVADVRDAATHAGAKAAAVAQHVTVVESEIQSLREAYANLSAELDAMRERAPSLAASRVSFASPATQRASTPVHVDRVLGRWLWKRRIVTEDDSRIVWDLEALNASPQELRWGGGTTAAARDLASPSSGTDISGLLASPSATDSPATEITTVRGGVYKIQVAIFAASPPALTICINGEAVLSTLPPEVMATPGSPSGSAPPTRTVLLGSHVIHAHSGGSICGVTLMQYLALPRNARVSIIHIGEAVGQGFIELEKV